MKFGREYEAQMIQEWREAYMDYRSLKSIVKQILRYHLQKQQRPYHPPPLPTGETAPLHAASTAPTGASGLSRRVSLYRAFSGLTNRVKGGSPRKSHKHNNPLSSKRHYHLFDEDEEQAILINEDETGSYNTTFLCSSEEGGEMEVQFFRRLDEEFNKVLRFYKQKVESVMEEADELSRQLNVLIALRVKVENPNVDFPDINSISSAPSSPRATNRTTAISPMEVIKEMEQAEDKKVFKPAQVEMLDHIKLKIEPETPLSMLKCMIMGLSTEQTFSKPELKRAEELMDRAFVEFYQKLRFLKGYSFLNQLAFSKILKKYDKVSRLMSRVEATFIKHFANGNHRDGMKCLRPKAKREKHRITYFLGDIYFWSRYRVNYPFIFGFEQGNDLGYREVLLLGSGLAVLTFGGAISNLDMEMDPRTKSFSVITELVPLGLLIVQTFRSLLFYVCYYGWGGDFKKRTHTCYESDIYKELYLVVAIIPYWFRFAQCIRRLVEEKDKANGLNALKYLSTILAVAARTIFETKRGTYWLTVAVTTSTIATLFNTYWDIFRDWGLMNRNSKNPWLRDKLLIPYKSIYFIAMVKLTRVYQVPNLGFIYEGQAQSSDRTDVLCSKTGAWSPEIGEGGEYLKRVEEFVMRADAKVNHGGDEVGHEGDEHKDGGAEQDDHGVGGAARRQRKA
ncbi:hypothetical protein Bca101_063986 [Brassica carinata]